MHLAEMCCAKENVVLRLHIAVQLMGSHLDACLSMFRGQTERSPYEQGRADSQALDLTTIKFHGVLTVDFLKFNLTVLSEGSTSVKLSLMLYHEMKDYQGAGCTN